MIATDQPAVREGTVTYVYGVVPASGTLVAGTGIADAPLRRIVAGRLAALVSDLPGDEVRLGRKEMTAHARVLESALQHQTVLPMRFGVVMVDDGDVEHDLLAVHQGELEAQLERFAGTVELRVRAMYDEHTLMRGIVNDNPDIARLRRSLSRTDQNAAYYARIRLGEMVAEAVERRRDADSQRIIAVLRPLAMDTHLTPAAHEQMVVSASFLVKAERMEEFDAAVDDVAQLYAERMRFTYTGPLPPHSFVELSAGT